MALVTAVLVLVVAGCGDDDDDDEARDRTTTSSSSTSTTTTSTVPTTAPADEQGGTPIGTPTTDVVATDPFPGNGPVALLDDVRLAGHDGFDRLVFQFRGPLSGYRVGYVQGPVREDGSGEPVDIEGEAFLEVVMAPASGVDLSGGAEPVEVYTGPDRVRSGDTELVTEVVRTGDFEATLSWGVGLRRQVPFGVAVLTGPDRLVIDFVP